MSPSEIAALVDRHISAKQRRLELQKQAREVEEVELDLRRQLLGIMTASDDAPSLLGGTQGRSVSLRIDHEPIVADWTAFREYVTKHGAWDLMQKRLNGAAIKARADDGEPVPGIELMTLHKLSVSGGR